MRKVLISLMIIYVLTFSLSIVSFASIRELSLKESIEEALLRSLSLEEVSLKKQEAKLNLQQIEGRGIIEPSPAEIIQAEKAVENYYRKYQMKKFSLAKDITKAYYNVLKAQDMIELSSQAVKIALRDYEIAREKLKQGEVSQREVLNANKILIERQEEQEMAKDSLPLALLNYRNTIGFSLTEEVYPKEPEDEFELYETDIEKDIKNALIHSPDLHDIKGLKAAALKQIEIIGDYTPPIVLALAENALAQAENGLRQLEKGLELMIRSSYQEIKNQERKIITVEKYLEMALEDLRVVERLKLAQMAIDHDVEQAKLGVKMAEIELRHSMFDYNFKVLKYIEMAVIPLHEVNN